MGRNKLFKIEAVRAALERWVLEHGHAPTVREFAEKLSVSTRTAHRYLDELDDRGFIERKQGARAIRLHPAGSDFGGQVTKVPVLGEAPAGALLLAEENTEGHVRLPQEWLRPKETLHYLLKVRGNSMNRAQIHGQSLETGDLVLVRQQPTAEPGAVVVAMVDGEVTIKRLGKGDGYWVLKPESDDPTHGPILLTEDFRVQGEVTRVLKGAAEHLEAAHGKS